MSKVKIQGNASGTGVLTVTAPNTSTDRTITLPDSTGTLATTADTFNPDAAVTINESGADVDFRVEGDNKDDALFVQGSNSYVGIGTKTPERPLTIDHQSSATSLGGAAEVIKIAGSAIDESYCGIGFHYDNSGGQTNSPAFIGYQAKNFSGNTNGDLVFATRSATSDSAPTERMRILAAGGLTFNGDLGTSNALDDYEEGSWTPALRGGTTTGSPTYWSRNGTYTKVGRQVHIQGGVHVNSLVNLDGIVYITGLPFTAQAQSHTINFSYGGGMNITAGTYIAGYTSSNGTEFVIRNWDSSLGTTNLDDAELSDGAQVIFSGSYFI